MANFDTRTGTEAGILKAHAANPDPEFETFDEFLEFIQANYRTIYMPKMSKEVFEELMEAKSLAGYHKKKERGTFQSNILDLLRDGDDALARWIKKMRELLPKGNYINDFMNLNSGLCEESGWHRDRPTEGTTIAPNTGRAIAYVMQKGKRGSLRVRSGKFETEIVVPTGCAIYATNELLGLEHCHGLNGLCLSYVLELSVQRMPVEAPQAAWDAAGRAQQAEEIDFEAHLEPWMPETFFLGAKLKYGFVGGGSVRRLAMAWYRGLKMGHGYPRELGKDEARALVSALTPEDLAEAASQQGMLTWRIGSLHRGSNETLMHARLLARALTLEKYEAMPERERRQLCDQLWARAVADAALRRAGGEAAVRLWELKELRERPSLSAAELETRIALEAGEAADEEAVAKKAQMKRTARGDLTAEEAIAQAAAEGLRLVPASIETGYKGVYRHGGRYKVQITENGKQMYGGSFETAEHAALQYARLLGPERSAAAAAAAASGHSRKRRADGAPAATTSGRIRRAPSCRE